MSPPFVALAQTVLVEFTKTLIPLMQYLFLKMRYYDIIVEANDLFLHKHFGKCLDVCQRYSKEAKTHLEDPG